MSSSSTAGIGSAPVTPLVAKANIGMSDHAITVKQAISNLPDAAISEREAALLIADILDAAGVVGGDQRDRVLQHAAREFSAGDQVPGGGM